MCRIVGLPFKGALCTTGGKKREEEKTDFFYTKTNLNYIVNVKILSLNLFSKTTQRSFKVSEEVVEAFWYAALRCPSL